MKNIEFDENMIVSVIERISKKLEKIAVEKVYCIKETCNHVTHPPSRMEVTGEQIDQVLSELGLNLMYGVEYKNKGAKCRDYFVIYKHPILT